MSAAVHISNVESLVRRGWQRQLLVLIVDEAAIVLALLAAGFSLLIVLGTQILSAKWLLPLGVIGLFIALRGIRRRLLDRYRVAQLIDQRLSLDDFLSTAWFLKTEAPDVDEAAAGYQLLRAEQLARDADLAVAFPFERRKSWIATALVCALALSLFSARYLVTRELSLKRAFLPVQLTEVIESLTRLNNLADRNKKDDPDGAKLPLDAMSQPDGHTGDAQGAANRKSAGPQSDGQAAAKNNSADAQNGDRAQNPDGKSGDQDSESSGRTEGELQNAQANKQSGGGSQQEAQSSNGGNKSESLMDRMRDALSSVMAKIKPSNSSQGSQSASQKGAKGQQNPDQASMKDQSGDGQKDSGNQQTAQEQGEGDQQGQGAAKSQQSQGRDSAQSSDKKGADAQSGVGHSDGDKELKAAEEARAMGKLAEIIGKRSATLTGEMEIEPSGKQELQTQNTHRQGQHADLGGEINRDEIPVEDQEYVREYMELVRKQAAKSSSSTSGH